MDQSLMYPGEFLCVHLEDGCRPLRLQYTRSATKFVKINFQAFSPFYTIKGLYSCIINIVKEGTKHKKAY